MPVDPKTELPEYIVDAAAWSRDGTAEDAEAVRNWIEETQNINATYTQWHPREVTGQTLLFQLTCGPFRVKLYHSLFGLPHVLFKEVVSKL